MELFFSGDCSSSWLSQLLAPISVPEEDSEARLGRDISNFWSGRFGLPKLDSVSEIPLTGRSKGTVIRRLCLPLSLKGTKGPTTVLACPDSGSDENIIALETVETLGFAIEPCHGEPMKFVLANGNTVEAIGQISAICSFTRGAPETIADLNCMFYVFRTLATAAIMGIGFLETTETLSKHRDRLIEETVPVLQALRVQTVNRPKRNLICRMGTYSGCANADTGSDLDLVSLQYANAKAFNIETWVEKIMFADGSVDFTSGLVRASFSVGYMSDVVGFVAKGRTLNINFHVFPGLTSDILVGQDTLAELDVFTDHSESFTPSISRLGESDINIIRHIGSVEIFATNTIRAGQNWVKNMFGNMQVTEESSNMSPEQQQDLQDQRENALREMELREYNRRFGGQCLHPGCEAAFLRTQFPLDTNTDIHSAFCPYSRDSRISAILDYETDDERMRRRNDLTRHSLIHDSPEYVCPFCENQQFTYTTQHLIRHVRIRHPDKSMHDPELMTALANDPEETCVDL